MLELTSAIALLVTSLYSSANVAVAQDIVNSDTTQDKNPVENPVTLEKYVQAYFAETPILAKVSKCESGYRQFAGNGQILRGEVNKDDVGLMQINEHYHGDKAKVLGLDLETVNGNLAYAKHLYEIEGTAPWSASKTCWNK